MGFEKPQISSEASHAVPGGVKSAAAATEKTALLTRQAPLLVRRVLVSWQAWGLSCRRTGVQFLRRAGQQAGAAVVRVAGMLPSRAMASLISLGIWPSSARVGDPPRRRLAIISAPKEQMAAGRYSARADGSSVRSRRDLRNHHAACMPQPRRVASEHARRSSSVKSLDAETRRPPV